MSQRAVTTNRPSGTATLIATSLLLIHNDPDYGDAVSDESAALAAQFLRAIGSGGVIRFASQRWVHHLARMAERLTIPGILRHYVLRKKCIAQLARAELASGMEQVVVLGAGFDPLGALLHRENPQTEIWEADHPDTQQYKRRALTETNPEHFHLVGADLATPNPDLKFLLEGGFSAARKTLWIAEGLLMYLRPDVVRELFHAIGNSSATGSRFIYTFMERAHDGSIRFRKQSRLVNWWLGRSGEPFLWGATAADLNQFIEPWQIVRFFDAVDLRELDSTSEPGPLAEGELICLARLP